MRLYIIGNGFDCYVHNYKTRYSDFRNYLEKNNKDLLDIVEYIFENKDYVLWNDFEKALGYPEKRKYDYLSSAYGNDDLSTLAGELKKVFNNWALAFDIENKTKDKKIDIIDDKNTRFLSFNYTHTLEEVYGISHDKICYIHGEGVSVAFEEKIIFGHGRIVEVKDNCTAFINFFYKDAKTIFENCTAIKEYQDIDEIISIGFSYADVDDFYIEKIITKTNNNTVWKFYKFESNLPDFDVKKAKIIKLGFKGKFCLIDNK